MKIKRIILFFTVFIALSQCKKEPEELYSDENIVLDNAQAALYFHTIFREAENAWAFVNDKNYEAFTDIQTDPDKPASIYKKYTYSDKDIIIDYHAWLTNHLILAGTIRVNFAINSYRSDGMVANVYLTDFSINGQDIKGNATIKYKKNDNDQYEYKFFDGVIHEYGFTMPVLISGNITTSQYERIEGGETKLLQDDDVWAYSGTMTGMLHDDPKLNYTNKVLTSYIFENGENGVIHFTMDKNCLTAKKGASQITIPGRPDIIYGYFCSGVDFISVTTVH